MEAKREKPRVLTLRAVEATPESFAPFGQVIAASPDGDKFYIMRLESKPLKFSTITHHAGVTQCLGSIGGHDWYLGVAKPSILDGAPDQSGQHDGRSPMQSRAGHYYLPPDPAEVCVFRVSGPKFLELHTGTWHAGPLFKADVVDFYNLELSDTNVSAMLFNHSLLRIVLLEDNSCMTASTPLVTVVDRTTHSFKKHDGVTFVIED
ncbi:hypothetical protein ACQ4PT_048986 [Festuca glaucescens]